MSQNRERILITGSRGKIGLAITPSLKEIYDVVELDTKIEDPDNNKLFTTNIADFKSLEEVFKKAGPFSAITHLAGNANDKAPWHEIVEPNILGVINIYECARNYGVKRVIFASSTHIMGSYEGYPQTQPLGRLMTVMDPTRPDGPYGSSKEFGESVARQYYYLHGIESICIRIGSLTANDKPVPPYDRVWLSHKDAAQLFRKALESNIQFGIYYSTSDNTDLPYDMAPTKSDLGYSPQDRN